MPVSAFLFVLQISFWMTCVEGWGNFLKVLRTRTDVYFYLIKQLIRLNISFQLPVQPVHLFGTPGSSSSAAHYPSSLGGAKERTVSPAPAPFPTTTERRVVNAAGRRACVRRQLCMKVRSASFCLHAVASTRSHALSTLLFPLT